MTDVSRTERRRTTAGLDLGDKHSHLRLLDTQSGEVIEESRLRTTPQAFERRFGSEEPLKIAIEVGTHSPWVSRLLKHLGHEVLVANARKVRLIYAQGRKTDRIDAEKKLARLLRLDPSLLYPIEHRNEDCQAHTWPSSTRGRRWYAPAPNWSTTCAGRSSPLGHVSPNARPGASITRSPTPCLPNSRRPSGRLWRP